MILTFETSHGSALSKQGVHTESQIITYRSHSPKQRKIVRNNIVHLIKSKTVVLQSEKDC